MLPKLSLRTKITLVIHAKELKRTTNTGRLALKALSNSELRVRGADTEALDLSDLLTPNYRSVLFYPSEEALTLNAEFVAADPRPIQLIVPDGNWRQASKVHTRHKEFKSLPRVTLAAANRSAPVLRKESKAEGMATLEAIAQALVVLEGSQVGSQIMSLYELKRDRTLASRGALVLPKTCSANAPDPLVSRAP